MTDEERLRRALVDLAPRATPDEGAYVGLDRAITRRRHRRAATRVTALILVLGVAAGVLAGRTGEHRRSVETPPASETPGPSIGPTTTAPGATRVPFANVSFVLPPGWEVVQQGGKAGAETMCVAPAGNPEPRYDGCGGLALYHGELPGYHGARYVRDGDWGFAHAKEPAPCPVRTADPGTGADVVVAGSVGKRPIDTGLRNVGNHKANYDQWFARCRGSHFTFTPRAWFLPTSRVVILDVLGHPETEDILASFRFGSEGD